MSLLNQATMRAKGYARVEIRLDERLAADLDDVRGDVDVAVYIRRLIAEDIAKTKAPINHLIKKRRRK